MLTPPLIVLKQAVERSGYEIKGYASTTKAAKQLSESGRGDATTCPTYMDALIGSPPHAWRRCRILSTISPLRWFTSTRVETLLALP